MNHNEIEKKWQKYWEEKGCFKAITGSDKKPYYVLVEFPYPSGNGLHVGHVRGYTAQDAIARMKRMQGYNVLYPMGWDAFGAPAEQYAIKNHIHPKEAVKKNIQNFKRQMMDLGFSFDWDREFSTTDPEYYKWTQWQFLQFYKHGMAYKDTVPVNWCPTCKSVLSNEDAAGGVCERCGTQVVQKEKSQWMLRMSDYSEDLLEGLKDTNFAEKVKLGQINWIGKSIGANVNFKIKDTDKSFTVFTTRCDTLFGATYCVMAPEHELVSVITTDEQREDVNKYIDACKLKNDMERTELNKDKTGVFTGAYAINPVNGREIPIWISDYVLVSYGTGAIMAVPAHDTRDFEFATKFGLEIIPVLQGPTEELPYIGDGVHINSEFLNGLDKEDAISKMLNWLEENNVGHKQVNYKIRDWIFARQRYWGEPIPIINFEDGTSTALDDSELPLVLPKLQDYAPSKNGDSPLEKATDWVNVTVNGKKGKRETSTMPGSAGSSWYFLRYIDPHNDKQIADPELLKHWLPVDLYIGGPEHAVGHLIYSRVWNNYLHDKNIVPVAEPFKKLVHQGMILGANGIKMGKRYPEFAVNPNDIVDQYGADTLRLYEMFMGPLEANKPWNENGVEGARRFIERVYRMFEEKNLTDSINPNLEKVYNTTVKKVTEDYDKLSFNTAISQLMIFVNTVYKENDLPKEYAKGFIQLLNPIAPFITEEIWNTFLGHTESIAYSKWPTYDESKTVDDEIELPIQLNGKLKTTLKIQKDSEESTVKEIVHNNDTVKSLTEGKTIVKEIYVKNKIYNIVVK